MTTSKRILTIEGLTTRLATEHGEVTAIDNVALHVDEGEVLGIVGESGSGKSVTAEAIMRLHDPHLVEYSGSVKFRDTELIELSEKAMQEYRGGEMAMIFQDPMSSLNPVFSIGDQLIETIQVHQKSTKEQARSLAIESLGRTHIPNPEARMADYPHQLSGGMRQRVMIAMALSCKPSLLIADEPTTALDVTTQAQILSLIEELQEETGSGVILITHDLGVVAEVCDRVSVMYLGQVVESGSVADVMENPRHPYTQRLLAATPTLQTPRDKDLPTIPGRVPTLFEVPYGCRFAGRCPLAEKRCKDEPQELVGIDGSRDVRCWKTTSEEK